VDDESNPAKATENANKLVQRDKVDVLVGTVHSGVALGMAKVAKESRRSGSSPTRRRRHDRPAVRAQHCSARPSRPGRPSYAMGKVLKAKKGHKNVVTLTWKYSFGEAIGGRLQGSLREGRRQVVKE
jgi:branched-chain amino acid transport system substrate-binding protein